MTTIDAIYADGGVIGANPSPIGGTWAYCHVVGDAQVKEDSGHVWPSRPLLTVSNNITEMVALLQGLSNLPVGWTGKVYSDSRITLGRVFWGWKWNNVPQWILDAYKRVCFAIPLDQCTPILLDGHPTKAQLAAGIGKRGNPVSIHNVWCDQECTRLANAAIQRKRSILDELSRNFESR